MTFKVGKSGNPNGRPKGAVSRRVRLANLLEPHAEELISKTIELALEGDSTALRLCIERLIPKTKYEPLDIELPAKLDNKGIAKLNDEIMQAVLDGRLNIDEADRLKKFITEQPNIAAPLKLTVTDPIEAMRAYERIMKA
ncbi:MAG: DUF5681 domain-containing protein [Pseudomonadota bacterium]